MDMEVEVQDVINDLVQQLADKCVENAQLKAYVKKLEDGKGRGNEKTE